MAYLELLTSAAGPIDIALAKAHGRIRNDLEDALIQVYLDSVFEYVEDFTGKDIRQKTYKQTGEQLNSSVIKLDDCTCVTGLILEASQVTSIQSVFYAVDGVQTELTSTDYNLYKKLYQSFITPASGISEFPDTDGGPEGYTIEFTTDWADLPSQMIGAMLSHFMFFYENRGDAIAAGASAGSGLITLPPESERIYKQYRATRI